MTKVKRESHVEKRLLGGLIGGGVPLLHHSQAATTSSPPSTSSSASNDEDDDLENARAMRGWKRDPEAAAQPLLPILGNMRNGQAAPVTSTASSSATPSSTTAADDEDTEGKWMMRGWKRQHDKALSPRAPKRQDSFVEETPASEDGEVEAAWAMRPWRA